MLVWSIAVDLEPLIFRMRSELPKPTRQIGFDVPVHVFQNLRALHFGDVLYRRRRMCGVDRVRSPLKEAIVVDNPATRVAVFCRGTAGDAIEVPPAEELLDCTSGLSWAANHVPGLDLFPHCLSQNRLSLNTS